MVVEDESGASLKHNHNPLNRDIFYIGSQSHGQMMNRPLLKDVQGYEDKQADQSAFPECQLQNDAIPVELPTNHPDPASRIFAGWVGVQRDYPTGQCLHQLVEARVERTPNAVAIIFGQEQLSYEQLNQRANQLAHYLQQLGVQPEVRVGICVDRSVEMLVGLMGILKAGGAYVPLDPSYPTERLAFMLADAQISVLLTQEHLLNRLSTNQTQTLCLDSNWQQIATQSTTTPASVVSPGNLAYVIYTSGTTGTPRGVMINHKEVVNRIFAMIEAYKLDANDRVLQFVSLSFDASIEEIFPILTVGGTLIVYQKPTVSLVAELLLECEKFKVTLLHLPAAYWHEMVEELSTLRQNVPASVKTTIVGGESPSLEKLVTWSRLVKHQTKFMNVYGPTETTITSTYFEILLEVENVSKLKNISIGKPLANTEIYVLDANLQLVQPGIPGEIYIGAAGLARGYLGRPELTAEKFIPHPFSAIPGTRLYKTGDQARYLPDGAIEFLGRVDQQVKIRGNRVELSEIESVLALHPAIRQSIVVAHEEITGVKYLVAYVVLRREQMASVNILQSYVSQHLPNYMVPSAFVFLDKLPLTSNGKIDRHTLPIPEQTRPVMQSNFVAARTPLEELIITAWSRVLGIDQLGVYDNFFALGGHSLLAMQILSQLRTTFSVEVPIHRFLETPTVAQLAELLQHFQTSGTRSSKPPLQSIFREAYRIHSIDSPQKGVVSNM